MLFSKHIHCLCLGLEFPIFGQVTFLTVLTNISILPLNNSILMRDTILKSLSGVMMAVTLPNMLPTPNSKSMMKYSTDHSCDNGIFLIASLYIMKARPGPSAA